MKVLELLTDESKWTQGANARTKFRSITMPLADDAICWCLEGAILYCYGCGKLQTVLNMIRDKIDDYSVHEWNDTHTFAEVRDLIRELDI